MRYLIQFKNLIPQHKGLIIFGFFLVIHLCLLNINSAEWGDSYRILRASEYIRQLSYPSDEKRPPLFSFILSIRPSQVDPILWGRIEMLVISSVAFFVFAKLVGLYIKDKKYQALALGLFALNPVYLYWSLRIYADVPFSLLVMLAFYFFEKWKRDYGYINKYCVWILPAVCGLLAGLAVLTRFEGYLLAVAVGFGFLLFKKIKPLVIYGVTSLILVLPFLIWRNPFTSSYFEEPAGRAYDAKMLVVYIVSILFMFGFTSAFAFLLPYIKSRFIVTVKENLTISVFIILELILILIWPAAIPRLFVPIIPFLLVALVLAIKQYFDSNTTTTRERVMILVTHVALIGVYIVGQYILKLQFLVLVKSMFVITVGLQVALLYPIFFKKYKLFVTLLLASVFIWSFSTIWLHKANFIAIKNAAEYASNNLSGIVGYNDVSSVSDWYLNQWPPKRTVTGVFYSYAKKKDLDYSVLQNKGFDYLILTNEHNTDMTLDIESRPYLTQVKAFEYLINGKLFFARIIKINK